MIRARHAIVQHANQPLHCMYISLYSIPPHVFDAYK